MREADLQLSRRTFLQRAGVVTLGLAVATSLGGDVDDIIDRLAPRRLLVAGAGNRVGLLTADGVPYDGYAPQTVYNLDGYVRFPVCGVKGATITHAVVNGVVVPLDAHTPISTCVHPQLRVHLS